MIIFTYEICNAASVTNLYFNFIVCCRWGPPKKLLSDQGREFVNDVNQALAAEFKVKRMVTSAYRPQTNGIPFPFKPLVSDP